MPDEAIPEFEEHLLVIDGMQSDACVRSISRALGGVPGVRVYSVAVGKASVLTQPACEPGIRDAVEAAGFHLSSMQLSHFEA